MFIPFLLALAGCGGDGAPPTFTGTVEITEVRVAPMVPGRLAEVLVAQGDPVSRGDTLFTLDTRITEVELEAREAALAMAEAAVATGKAQQRAALAQVEVLDRELTRVRSLEASGAGTAQQTSQMEGQLKVARAQAAAAREGVAQAEAAVGQAQAARDLVAEKIRESTAVAPLDGLVLSRSREPGEVLGAGMSVVTIGDVGSPRLRVYVPLTTLQRLDIGSRVEVRLDGQPGEVHAGKIAWIAHQAQFTPRDILTPDERVKQVFAVDVALEPATGLHPGVPAEAVFPDISMPGAITESG